jgi:hypothetical protein
MGDYNTKFSSILCMHMEHVNDFLQIELQIDRSQIQFMNPGKSRKQTNNLTNVNRTYRSKLTVYLANTNALNLSLMQRHLARCFGFFWKL